MSDEELANQQGDKALLLGTITVDQWRYILKKEARSLVLELAEQGWEAVSRFLASVPEGQCDLNPISFYPSNPLGVEPAP